MSLALSLYHKLTGLTPETRCYSLRSRLLSRCGYKIHPRARIVASARFIGAFHLSVGDDTFIGHEVLVAGGGCSITIGSFCDLAPRVSLIAGSHEIDMLGKHTAGTGYSSDITIDDGVWVGANVTVLGGVRIGAKSVIAAGSTVTHDIPANVIAAGTPCRVIKVWDEPTQKWVIVKSREI